MVISVLVVYDQIVSAYFVTYETSYKCFYFFYTFFPNSALISAAADSAAKILFPTTLYRGVVVFEPTSLTSVELHCDPGPIEGRSTD